MIFGTAPFGVLPFGDTGQSTRVYFSAEFFLDVSYDFSIYIATAAGFATRPTDVLPSQPFRGVLQSFSFERSIMGGSEIGVFATGSGSLVFSNVDAFYDFLPESYTIDATTITLRATRADRSYDAAFLLSQITATGWHIDTHSVSIDVRDFGYKLDVPMQPNLYAGTGGKNGGADLAGKRIPISLGRCLNVPAPLVVPALLIYQVNDGPVQSIVAVYDSGFGLTFSANYASYALLAAAVIAGGSYATCTAEGLFRLGATPAGLVTADVNGDNSDGYVETSADIVRWALRNRTVIDDPSGLATSSFDAVNSLQPAPIAYWIGPDDSLSVADFIANVMGGIGGWGGHRRDSLFEVRIFSAPSGTPVAYFTRKDMIGDDISREPLPSAYRPPPWRWRVPYARAWVTQTDNLSGSVSAARVAFLAQSVRIAEASNDVIKVDSPFAQDREPIQAYFALQVDALAEATRRINLFKTTRALYRFVFPRRALRLDLGDVIHVTYERFDLASGRLMTVLHIKENIAVSENTIDAVEVVCYG